MTDLLREFLVEASDIIGGVGRKLAALKGSAEDQVLLNDISRAFHTLKGGAAVLDAVELANLCHLCESALDKMRHGECGVSARAIDAISRAAGQVRETLYAMRCGEEPEGARPELVHLLNDSIADDAVVEGGSTQYRQPESVEAGNRSEPNWAELYNAIVEKCSSNKTAAGSEPSAFGHETAEDSSVSVVCRTADVPEFYRPGAFRDDEPARNAWHRACTGQPDRMLNLTGEIGLTKNRLATLRSEILSGKLDGDRLHALDVAVNRLDLLVSELRSAVMQSRKKPIARLFQKYPRIASNVAREFGKEIELVLEGEDTEIDDAIIEELADPLGHLVRNAVEHGCESPEERGMAWKPEKAIVKLEARKAQDHVIITVSDDGRGIDTERLRTHAVGKGLISDAEANAMGEREILDLFLVPGFTTKVSATDLPGRRTGMDVVRASIRKLNGSIDICSTVGRGTSFVISLPITPGILSVLLVHLRGESFAVSLSTVLEILSVDRSCLKEVGGRTMMAVRGELLPMYYRE